MVPQREQTLQEQLLELRQRSGELLSIASGSGLCAKEAEVAKCMFHDPVSSKCMKTVSYFLNCISNTKFWSTRSHLIIEAKQLRPDDEKDFCAFFFSEADSCLKNSKSSEANDCDETVARARACTIVNKAKGTMAYFADKKSSEAMCAAFISECRKCMSIKDQSDFLDCAMNLMFSKSVGPKICDGKLT